MPVFRRAMEAMAKMPSCPSLTTFCTPPQGPTSPVAAYVITPDLVPGTQVFVEDAIEDLVCQMPQ